VTPDAFEGRAAPEEAAPTEVPHFTDSQVEEAVGRGREAQQAWIARTPGERFRLLRGLSAVLHRRSEDIAAAIRSETGKPPAEALTEVVVSVDLIRFYASKAARHLRPRRVRPGWMLWKRAWVGREPYGVVGAITPWNYPFILPMDCVTPAIFAGNAVVIKPSEFTPVAALLIPELCREAGLPEGLVQVVTGDGGAGRALVESGVDRLVFTGSTRTGKQIMAAAAERLTPVTLELGGKDAAIVLEDADIERAARGVVFGALFNAGQTCLSIERIYVARAVHDEFVHRVVTLVEDLRVGHEADVDVGPLVTDAQVELVERHVRDALEKGARVLAGGRRQEPGSSVFLPTVLVGVGDSMDVVSEESFGPLLPIIAVEDDEDAVRRCNESGYGLFASVWTRDRARGLRIARRLRAGGISVNDVLAHYGVAGLPMGGVGLSGFGSRRGLEALDEMSRPHTVFVDRLGLKREPWWFPYSSTGTRLIHAVLDWRGLGGLGGATRAAGRFLRRGR
jgi:succinate-semialdehyde dehydrogenase/glutarate-semialdehyde dehydrogenase